MAKSRPPRGEDLLALLVDLLADQHQVKITYQIEDVKGARK